MHRRTVYKECVLTEDCYGKYQNRSYFRVRVTFALQISLLTVGSVWLTFPASHNQKQSSKIYKHWKSYPPVLFLVFASVTTSLPPRCLANWRPGWLILMAPSTLKLCRNQEQQGAVSITESFFPFPLFSADFLPRFLRYSLPTGVSPNRGLFSK